MYLIELPGLLTGLKLLKSATAARAVALDISKAFDKVWHGVLLHKRKSYGISGQIFGFISSFLSNRHVRSDLDGKSSQEYPVNSDLLISMLGKLNWFRLTGLITMVLLM